MGGFIAQHTQPEILSLMEQAEVTIGPIYDVSQIMTDPHVIERELLADYPDDQVGEFPMHHVVPRMFGTPGAIRMPASAIGQHNRELLSEIGIDAAAYDGLLSAGVAAEAAAPGPSSEAP